MQVKKIITNNSDAVQNNFVGKNNTRSFLGTSRIQNTLQKDTFIKSSLIGQNKKTPLDLIKESFEKIKNFLKINPISNNISEFKEASVGNTIAFKGNSNNLAFREVDTGKIKQVFLNELGCSEKDAEDILNKFGGNITLDGLSAEFMLYGINPKEASDFLKSQLDGKTLDQNGIKAFNNLMQTMQLREQFKNSPYFSAFNLNLEDVNNIRNIIKEGDSEDIYYVLLEKNPKLATLLCDNDYFRNSYNKLTELVDNSVYKQIPSKDIVSLGIINGKEKFVIMPNSTSIPKLRIPADKEKEFLSDMIKSNMMTKDIVDELSKDKEFLSEIVPKKEEIKIKGKIIKSASGAKKEELIRFDVNPVELINKVHQEGIDSLSSHEIHVLTKVFSDLYNENPKFQKIVNNLSKTNSSQYNNIYSYVEHLKKLSSATTSKYGVTIEDHAFMRMLDRNLLSVTDNKGFRRLKYEEFIELISKNAKNNITEIQGYNGSSGIKLITENKNGKTIIKTVI